MDYYIDVKIKPDSEMRENVLLNKVYTKFHKALWTMKASSIGISFPKLKHRLGDIMRIHGKETDLRKLAATKRLGGLIGYCAVAEIQPIPTSGIKYRNISRVQANMTQAKLRRLLKRGSITPDEARKYKAKMFTKGLDLPYLEMESGSDGHKHRRYLAFGDITEEETKGTFDYFGLSKSATIPWF